jgi:hypothetical protein
MAGALSRIGCGSANRPARGWLGSWARANVSACSARSPGSSAATPVAWTRSHPVREQVHDAPLQPLGAGGSAEQRRLASLQNPWAGGGGLQRRGGTPVSSGRIGAEPVGPACGHQALLEHRHEHEVHPDEMIDDISHAPLRTRGRRRPLVGSYTVDQVARSCGCTCETVEDRRVCHSARLRHDRPGAPLVSGRRSGGGLGTLDQDADGSIPSCPGSTTARTLVKTGWLGGTRIISTIQLLISRIRLAMKDREAGAGSSSSAKV